MLFSLIAGCATSVKPATYREFPLSARPGSLLGPFHGNVRDADSKYAVKDALVLVTWDVSREGRSVRTIERTTTTDVNGAYSIPMLRVSPSLSRGGELSSVRIVVFHPDFQPYSSITQPFPEFVRRQGEGTVLLQGSSAGLVQSEFLQLDNLVLLKKIAAGHQANRHVLPVLGVAAVQNRILEEYYRASNEMNGRSTWVLEAGKLLMPEHVQEILEREDVPLLVREETRPDLSGHSFVFEMDRTVITVRAASMLGSMVEARLAAMLADVEEKHRVALGDEYDADMWMFTHRGMRYGISGLPHDGLILLIGCSEDACRPRTLRRMMRTAVSRKREIFFSEATSDGSLHFTHAFCPQDVALRVGDAVELGRIFSHPVLHKLIQDVYSLPLGIYEPLAIPQADQLRVMLDELSAVLGVRPDERFRIRGIGLLIDGGLQRLGAVDGRNTTTPADEAARVRMLFHAAAAATTPSLRAHLLANALFRLGRWVVEPDPTMGPRSRLDAFLRSLTVAADDASPQGRLFFEDAKGLRRALSLDGIAPLQLPAGGKLILSWPSGRLLSLPWPVNPELRDLYPERLLNREP
ncbi:hypothetical protein KKD52_16345 [Myxococcota bacterium]|nr:hypothetical protein [Myxococcota bacterium]MBU1511925.1 hypothetical protein [Myxococcota bacterium]